MGKHPIKYTVKNGKGCSSYSWRLQPLSYTVIVFPTYVVAVVTVHHMLLSAYTAS